MAEHLLGVHHCLHIISVCHFEICQVTVLYHEFVQGYIISLMKDKTGDINSVDTDIHIIFITYSGQLSLASLRGR